MDIASFVIGILGFVLAVASLVWQYATFQLSGGRVTAVLKIGIVSGRMQILGPVETTKYHQLQEMLREHGGVEVVAVEVRNTGRMPVTVRSWGLKAPSGMVASPVGDQLGPPLKHTIDAGNAETWAMPLDQARALANAETVLTPGVAVVRLRGVVDLADGRKASTSGTAAFDVRDGQSEQR